MKTSLSKLVPDTEFKHDGKRYVKGTMTQRHKTECYPILGGQPQPQLAEMVPSDAEVEVQ